MKYIKILFINITASICHNVFFPFLPTLKNSSCPPQTSLDIIKMKIKVFFKEILRNTFKNPSSLSYSSTILKLFIQCVQNIQLFDCFKYDVLNFSMPYSIAQFISTESIFDKHLRNIFQVFCESLYGFYLETFS